MNRTIVSLDFYGKGISVVVALFDTEQGSVRITKLARFDSAYFQDGQVLDVGRAQDELTYILEELSNEIGLNPKVIIGLRGPMLSFQRRTGFRTANARNCIIRDSDIQEALSNAVPSVLPASTQVIDIWPQSFVVEGKDGIQNPKGMPGITLEAETFISYADATYVADIKNVLHLCNLSNYRLLATAVPIARQLPNISEKQTRTLVLDIGDNSTEAMLYNKGLLIDGKSLALGHNVLIKEFAKLLENDVQTAQDILNDYQEDEVTDELIEDATEIMLRRIHRELCESSLFYVQNPPTQLILTGCGISQFTLDLAKPIFQVRKVRCALLETNAADEQTDLSQFTGALALIYHTLQVEESVDEGSDSSKSETFFEKLLTKIGFN